MPEYTPSGRHIADEPPDYPDEWNSEQRLTAYWYANDPRHRITVETTDEWRGVLIAANRIAERRHTKITELRTTPKLRIVQPPENDDDQVPF